MRKISMLKHLATITALAAMVSLGWVSSARALDQEIQITVDGNPVQIYHAPNGGTASSGGQQTMFGVTWNLTSNSNSPGDNPTLLVGSTLLIQNADGLAHNITINVGDTNFTTPTAPPGIEMLSHLGGTVLTGNANNTLSFQSWTDATNGQNNPAGITPGVQNTYSSGNITTTGSFALNDASTVISSLAAPFSLTSVVTLHLEGASKANFTSSLTLTPAAVPEPSSMAIAGLGALGLIGYGIRRRRGA